MHKMSKDDLESACCQSKYRRQKSEGGSYPVCTKCGKSCNLQAIGRTKDANTSTDTHDQPQTLEQTIE